MIFSACMPSGHLQLRSGHLCVSFRYATFVLPFRGSYSNSTQLWQAHRSLYCRQEAILFYNHTLMILQMSCILPVISPSKFGRSKLHHCRAKRVTPWGQCQEWLNQMHVTSQTVCDMTQGIKCTCTEQMHVLVNRLGRMPAKVFGAKLECHVSFFGLVSGLPFLT